MSDEYTFITMPRSLCSGYRQIIETIKAVQAGNRVRVVHANGKSQVYDKQNVGELLAMLGLKGDEDDEADSDVQR